MKEDTLRTLHIMTPPQKVHQKKKSVHNTYMFQLSGDKWLLHQFLRVPMFCDTTQTPTHSAERPVWNDLLMNFAEHKNSDDYRKAVADSQRKGADHVRLSRRIYSARLHYEKGKRLAFRVRYKQVNWHSLSPDDQQAVEDYEARRSANRLDEAIKEKEKHGTTRFHLQRMKS